MKRMLIAGAALLALYPPANAAAEDAQHALAWMEGCWISPDGRSYEIWSAPLGGMLFGYSVSLSNGEATFFEQLRIETGDGPARYVAYPSGQAPAAFIEISAGEHSVVFANPDHDYPQEISYVRDGDALRAQISLVGGEDPRIFEKRRCKDQ